MRNCRYNIVRSLKHHPLDVYVRQSVQCLSTCAAANPDDAIIQFAYQSVGLLVDSVHVHYAARVLGLR